MAAPSRIHYAGGAIGSWIFQDTQNCDGDGRWVRGTDGDEVCVSSAGILYYELGHVFLNHPDGSVDDDERAAVELENDLRIAEAGVPRDPKNWHKSECECPGDCCIVASVDMHCAVFVTGPCAIRQSVCGSSMYCIASITGSACQYHAFSSPALMRERANCLVQPLIQALELARQYAEPDNKGHERFGVAV
jgi:hypothetical protein